MQTLCVPDTGIAAAAVGVLAWPADAAQAAARTVIEVAAKGRVLIVHTEQAHVLAKALTAARGTARHRHGLYSMAAPAPHLCRLRPVPLPHF
jgi:hypothetical protein